MKYLILAAALLASPATAHEFAVGDITVDHPFAFATVGNAPVGGGYMTLTNTGETDDTLVSVSVDPSVAGMVQLHEMKMADGVMSMSEVPGGIAVPAGETVELKQGGLHVMFMRLPAGLAEGTKIPATLTFEKAGEVEVEFAVEARGAARKSDHSGDHSGDHSNDHSGGHTGH